MSRQQRGFTLIELAAVIVILGALAVGALPRFLDLQDEAESAALSGVQGAAGSAHAINLAAALTGDGDEKPITSCADTGNLLQASPADYTFGGDDLTPICRGGGRRCSPSPAEGAPLNCVVYRTADGPQSAVDFTGYVINP